MADGAPVLVSFPSAHIGAVLPGACRAAIVFPVGRISHYRSIIEQTTGLETKANPIRERDRHERQGIEARREIGHHHAADRRRVPRLAARRPHRLHLRRAGEGRDHAPGLPQHRAHGGAALRCAARQEARRQDHGADRHRQRRQDTRFLQGAEVDGRFVGGAQRDRRMGAHHLRLARPFARLQGFVPRHARRQRPVLRSLHRQREALVQVQPGAGAVRQSRHHPSAGRPRQAAKRSRRHLLPR